MDEHVGDERQWDAEGGHQHITARQTCNEVVGHGAHPTIDGDDRANRRVAADRDDNDDRVQDGGENFDVDRQLDRLAIY